MRKSARSEYDFTIQSGKFIMFENESVLWQEGQPNTRKYSFWEKQISKHCTIFRWILLRIRPCSRPCNHIVLDGNTVNKKKRKKTDFAKYKTKLVPDSLYLYVHFLCSTNHKFDFAGKLDTPLLIHIIFRVIGIKSIIAANQKK